jgi:hypothetical protein
VQRRRTKRAGHSRRRVDDARFARTHNVRSQCFAEPIVPIDGAGAVSESAGNWPASIGAIGGESKDDGWPGIADAAASHDAGWQQQRQQRRPINRHAAAGSTSSKETVVQTNARFKVFRTRFINFISEHQSSKRNAKQGYVLASGRPKVGVALHGCRLACHNACAGKSGSAALSRVTRRTGRSVIMNRRGQPLLEKVNGLA